MRFGRSRRLRDVVFTELLLEKLLVRAQLALRIFQVRFPLRLPICGEGRNALQR
jgi:hypothetical protein